MKPGTFIVCLALGFLGISPSCAALLPSPGKSFFLADSSAILKQKEKIKSFRKIKRGTRKAEEGVNDILGQHPIPRYTDYSRLNQSPKRMEKTYRLREFKAYKPVEDVRKQLKETLIYSTMSLILL